MNRKGPWEGYRRQAKRRLARCLLPAFLCAHVLKRDVWVRGSILSILEYGSSVFHRALPSYLSEDLERLQKRAMKIIYS